jgi:His/Glu/Gln/Arg/opine family amino acid ABC transporter permease subunit
LSYSFDWSVLWRYRERLLDGFALTLALSIASLIGAVGVGVLAGAAGESERRWPRAIAGAYVELARNVPLLVHLYVWYLGLTALRLPAFWCGVLGLSLYSGAYVAEIVRSGLQGVPAGQRAAGLASGLSPRQVLRHIVYPQALRIVAPSLAGLFSQLIKDSSLASVISVAELTFVAGAIEGDTFRTFEAYIGITVLYLVAVTAISEITLRTLRSRIVEPAMRY